MMRWLAMTCLAAGTLLSLSSCVTPQELRQQDESQCSSYGFKLGSNEFANCLQRESLARRYGSPPVAPPPIWFGPAWYGPRPFFF